MTSTTTTPKSVLKQDVAAIITAMTDDEELFLQETFNVILSESWYQFDESLKLEDEDGE